MKLRVRKIKMPPESDFENLYMLEERKFLCWRYVGVCSFQHQDLKQFVWGIYTSRGKTKKANLWKP